MMAAEINVRLVREKGMSTYKNILVAVDGSEESTRILGRARELAAGDGARLSVVLVFEPLLGHYSFELNMADYERLQQQHEEQVAASMREMVGAGAGADSVHFLRGKPAAEIRQLADKIGADLLVIGSHGHNPVRAVLGSTANSVLHGIHCDVLTIRV
jgi:universal stress protein A